MTQPLVTVIVPAFNVEPYIEEALQSILDQSYPQIEIIVVNDGSTDGTRRRVAAYEPRVRCLDRPGSGGFPGMPRNAGIEQSRGEYLCFLDGDDIMRRDRVERQIAFLREHPRAGLVFTDYRNFTGAEESSQTHFETCPRLLTRLAGRPDAVLPGKEAMHHLLLENFGGTGMLMIRREVLEDVPRFPTDVQTGEDFLFYYRAAACWDVGVINSVGTRRRLHDHNITNDSLRTLQNYVASRRALRSMEAATANIAVLNEVLFRAENDLACGYADRRHFSRALLHNWRALTEYPPYSASRLRLGLRTLTRTTAIAAHLLNPGSTQPDANQPTA